VSLTEIGRADGKRKKAVFGLRRRLRQKRLSCGRCFVAEKPTFVAFRPNGNPIDYDFANVFRNEFFR
jgi:hypothetical protein